MISPVRCLILNCSKRGSFGTGGRSVWSGRGPPSFPVTWARPSTPLPAEGVPWYFCRRCCSVVRTRPEMGHGGGPTGLGRGRGSPSQAQSSKGRAPSLTLGSNRWYQVLTYHCQHIFPCWAVQLGQLSMNISGNGGASSALSLNSFPFSSQVCSLSVVATRRNKTAFQLLVRQQGYTKKLAIMWGPKTQF